MRKSLLLFLILALTTAFAAPAKTIEIGFNSTDLSSTSSGYSTVNFKKDGVSFHAERINPSDGQFAITGTVFNFYNTTEIANIQKVEIYLKSGYKELNSTNASNLIITTSDTKLTSTGTGTDKAVLAGNKELADKSLKKAIKALDNAKVKGLVHKNKVDREKSRLTKKVNTMEVK